MVWEVVINGKDKWDAVGVAFMAYLNRSDGEDTQIYLFSDVPDAKPEQVKVAGFFKRYENLALNTKRP